MLQNYYHKNKLEAGCDEAGRGCYAGPVFAAAVILPQNFKHPLLNDSKQVKEKDRLLLRDYIIKKAKCYSIASVNSIEIDEINILKASIKAMHLAIDGLKTKPNFLLIDGNRFYPYKKIDHECIIKGDEKFASIAAASILAKTSRDEYMKALHSEFPMYGWDNNKGYGTLQHRKAIEQFGLTIYHRKSFNITPNQLKLF
ncbi:MAG: ribonuclease HII [Chitinophagaceae bacterium]